MKINSIRPLIWAAVYSLLLLWGCEVDRNYHLFIQPDPPDHFVVSVGSPPSMSICTLESGTSGITVNITAIDALGATDARFKRYVHMYIVDDTGTVYPLSPSSSPKFTEGVVTVENVSFSGVQGSNLQILVRDEKYSDITGISGSFGLNVQSVDHLEITIPGGIRTDVPFYLAISAVDANGDIFWGFNSKIDLGITTGFSITPATVQMSSGYQSFLVTVSGTGSFTITADINTTDTTAATCTGGGGGGGGGGGSGDGFTDPPQMANSLECILSPPTNEIMRGSSFYMGLTVTKTDTAGDIFTTFSGTADFSANMGATITPVTTPLNISGNPPIYGGNFSIDTAGSVTITALVSDIDFPSAANITCEGTVNIISGIGVYAPEYGVQQILVDTLNGAGFSQKFIGVTNINSIDSYDGLIVNFAGNDWPTVGQSMGPGAAASVKAFYDSGKPVIIAHDSMTQEVINALVQPIWGSISRTIIFLPEVADFNTDPAGNLISLGAPANKFEVENYCDGFSGFSGTQVASTTFNSSTHALIIATPSGTKAVLMGEAIWHPFGGQGESYETQWWESSQQLMKNIINWTFSP